MSSAVGVDAGESSNDECCICGQEWNEGEKGWVLCDACDNTVCTNCTQSLGLIVSDLFYCPPCSGSGQSAAATLGGAVATAVAACAELEALPLSFKAVQKILTNLSKNPDELKYRKLRLENKAVKNYIDLEPVLRILTSIGFVRREEKRKAAAGRDEGEASASSSAAPLVEQVLVLEGSVDVGQINELLEILDGLSPENSVNDKIGEEEQTAREKADDEGSGKQNVADTTTPDSKPEAKRSPGSATDADGPKAKKRREEN